MLTQLIEQIVDKKSVTQKFKDIEELASRIPENSSDIIALLNLCKYKLDAKEFPVLRQTELFVTFLECKQILVESEGYYYI